MAFRPNNYPGIDLPKQFDMETKSNKAIVAEFYKYIIKERNETLIDTYVHEDYIQHSPGGKDGREGLREMINFLKTLPIPVPEQSPVKLIMADDDMVVGVLSFTFMSKKMLVVDLFRLRDGKVAEHWDAVQEISVEKEIDVIYIGTGTALLENKKLIEAAYQQQNTKIHRIFGEGDLILVQAEIKKDAKRIARYDILRIKENQTTLCLSIQQPVPDIMMHSNGIF